MLYGQLISLLAYSLLACFMVTMRQRRSVSNQAAINSTQVNDDPNNANNLPLNRWLYVFICSIKRASKCRITKIYVEDK